MGQESCERVRGASPWLARFPRSQHSFVSRQRGLARFTGPSRDGVSPIPRYPRKPIFPLENENKNEASRPILRHLYSLDDRSLYNTERGGKGKKGERKIGRKKNRKIRGRREDKREKKATRVAFLWTESYWLGRNHPGRSQSVHHCVSPTSSIVRPFLRWPIGPQDPVPSTTAISAGARALVAPFSRPSLLRRLSPRYHYRRCIFSIFEFHFIRLSTRVRLALYIPRYSCVCTRVSRRSGAVKATEKPREYDTRA